MKRVLIIGCGYIGIRVAWLWQKRGASVTGIVRSDASAAALQQAGIDALRIDLDDAQGMIQLHSADALLYHFAPPPEHGDTDPRAARVVQALLQNGLPQKVIVISTSAVYGDCAGAWVDEDAPTVPASPRGKRRLHAEQTFRAFGTQTGVPVVILRVPGIYGPSRLPLERLKSGAPVVRADLSPYTNRVHADDLATICVAAADHGGADTVYNVSDGHPGTMTQYFLRIAALYDLPPPPQVDMDDARRVMSAGMLSYLEESRRLDNTKMLRELKVTLRYPDLETGLQAIKNGA